MKTLTQRFLLGAACMLASTAASAIDSYSAEFASGNKSQFVRGGLQWNWDEQWLKSNSSFVGGYWDATLTQWRNNAYQGVPGATQNITDVGFTPVFRWQQSGKKGVYAEAGIGLHLFSHVYNNNGRRFFHRLPVWRSTGRWLCVCQRTGCRSESPTFFERCHQAPESGCQPGSDPSRLSVLRMKWRCAPESTHR